MAKKNPYVTTIGFNKEDPDHVYVADFLNSMGRGKGQYIVKAIMAYQNPIGAGSGQVVAYTIDYEKIRTFVLKVIEEKSNAETAYVTKENPTLSQKKTEEQVDERETTDLDEATVNDIILALNMFR